TNVLATRLVFSTQPAGVISGLPLGTQPILMALDDQGQVDTSFAENVTLLLGQGSGRLYNNSIQAVNGVATFTNVIYVASLDGESITLNANDEDGVGSDLPLVTSNTTASDILATRLVFSTQPSGSISGQLLNTQPVVTALNDSGQVDAQFGDVVTLSISSAGKLHYGSVEAINGVATFTNVIYTALVDGETFVLTADDVLGGVEGNLNAVQSQSITSDVLATQMVFSTQPSGVISGQPLTAQPVVTALDDSGRVDTEFIDLVTLSSNVGSLTNNTIQAIDGVATFSNLIYSATLDRQTFTLSANDASGGGEGDLPVVTANSLVADVIATKLIYLVEPSGSVSGQLLSVQPVVVAVDAHDLIDIDFTNLVSLSVEGMGSLLNASRPAVSGIATFTQVIYQTASEPQPFRIRASADSVASVFSQILSTRVIARQLVFALQPAGVVSGKPFLVHPIVEARDSLGQIDRSFSETLTLTVNGPGGLVGHAVFADSGRAVFSNLIYEARSAQESFSISVDDEPGGEEGDLPPTTSNTLMCDVVATRLVFLTQPSGVVNGVPFAVQPVVAAVDSLGIVDQGVAENVSITTSIGTLQNANATMQNGIATFVGLKHLATSDETAFVLTADDQVGGLELVPVQSQNLTSDVIATRLVFSVQPGGSLSGKPMLVQPELMAVDSLGVVDLSFSENVNLTTQSSGTLTNIVVLMANGVGKTTTLTFTATQDHQKVVLVANDAVGGLDLALARSDTFECDVVATALMFQTQPQGADNGKKLSVQPVVTAHVQGVLDIDFQDVISLTSDGDGVLQNASVQAIGGGATFADVVYVAGHDKESVRLIANDTSNGLEGKLAQIVSSPFTTEVTATQLRFKIMPSGIISGHNFLTQPVVVAVDSLGVVDSDFEEQIVLTSNGGGVLANGTLVLVDGVANFSSVSYTATSGLETFVIQADDAVGGSDLLPAFSDVLTAGAGVAHHLGIFKLGPTLIADGVSSQQIAVRVLDENNNPRLDDVSTRVSLLVQGAATGGGAQIVKNGEVQFEVVSKTKTGTVYLQVSAEALLGAVDSFQTVAGEATTLKLVYDSVPLLANGISTREIKLQLLDANGNLRQQDNSTLVALGVSGSATDGGGTKSVKKGEAVFVVQAGTEPGLIQLRANAGGLPEVAAALIVGAIRPDLTIVKAPLGPDVISKNGSHVIQLTVQNTGLDTIRNAFDISVMLVGGADSIAVGRAVVPAPVAPDSILNITVSFKVPSFSFATLASDYHWVAIVDAGGFVVEDNETNNLSHGNSVAFPEMS
ncbi:MAG: CARDB domain-containing protein, partial [Candidatus Latescibacterota bacterium]